MSSKTAELSFGVLSLLSRERGVYGLRNGDHERYRRHCANKIHRFRQTTGSTFGKGKTVKKPVEPTKETIKDTRPLQLLLFSAERALAFSHELKALRSKPDAPRNTRRDQISWLRKALKYSTTLHTLATGIASDQPTRISQRTLAEITIYFLSVRAELSFERSAWAEALTDLAARRRLLSTISNAAKDSYDQALAIEFMDAYDPLIRFSAYKLGRSESHDIEGVVKDVDDEMMGEAVPGFGSLIDGLREEVGAEAAEEGRKKLEEITFAGDKIEVRNAEFVSVMLNAQEALARMKNKRDGGKGRGMRGWDHLLSVLGDAEGVAKRLLDDNEASSSSLSLRSTETAQKLSLAHQYIVFLLLSNRIQRDLLLVETLANSSIALPADPTVFKIPGGKVKVEEAVKSLAAIIKLYDTILQSLSQVRSLAIVEEKDGVRVMAEGTEAYFHATRCYHLARLHCIHPAPSYASAVQLLSRAALLVRQSRTSLFELGITLEEEIVPLPQTSIDDLAKQVDKLDLAAKRALFAERVDKPVFFDNAFNYIDLPMDELQVLAGRKPKIAKTDEKPKTKTNVVQKSSASMRTTRETTPAVEEEPSETLAPGQKPKGWLGGWFGRG